MNIPLCIPHLTDEKRLVNEVIDSGWYAHGPKCKEFEESFAKYVGVKHAVSLNSCTAALHLAIQANNLKGEVILPSFTFVASANAVITASAKPVFCDIDPETCNIDPADVEKRITERTQAIMPVHFAGLPCDMKRLQEIADKHGLMIIEDSAECIGGEFHGKKTGSFGTGCFSFYPTKNMTTGEGGMLTTDDDAVYEMAKALKGHGISTGAREREMFKQPWQRVAIYAGYNFRMSDILAAMGIVQLKKLDQMNEQRRRHAAYLNKRLVSEHIILPVEPKGYKHVYQMYTIRLSGNIDRDKLVQCLRENGIGASVHFDPPVHTQPYYRGFDANSLQNTEMVSRSIVTLPMYPGLKKEELDYIADNVISSLRKCGA